MILGVPPFKETPKSVCGNPNRGPIWELFEPFRQTEIFSAWQPLGPLLKVKLLVGYYKIPLNSKELRECPANLRYAQSLHHDRFEVFRQVLAPQCWESKCCRNVEMSFLEVRINGFFGLGVLNPQKNKSTEKKKGNTSPFHIFTYFHILGPLSIFFIFPCRIHFPNTTYPEA